MESSEENSFKHLETAVWDGWMDISRVGPDVFLVTSTKSVKALNESVWNQSKYGSHN